MFENIYIPSLLTRFKGTNDSCKLNGWVGHHQMDGSMLDELHLLTDGSLVLFDILKHNKQPKWRI